MPIVVVEVKMLNALNNLLLSGALLEGGAVAGFIA
jgi:hypothetical protein